MLVIVVGRSGAGKSSFIEAMDLEGYHCVLSQPMVNELKRRGQEVSHDTIHALAKEWYAANRWWQVEYILNQLGERAFLIIDGLRYFFELEELRRRFPQTIVVKIVSTPGIRYQRLTQRGKIPLTTVEEFERLERDESQDMGLEAILVSADLVVENGGSLDELREKAQRFARLLRPLIEQAEGS